MWSRANGISRCTSGISYNYPNEDGAEDDGHMSEDDEEPVDGEIPGQGDQAEGEEVRRNDEATSRTTRGTIKVVNKDISDHQKYLVKQVHRHMGHLPKDELIRVLKSGTALPEVLRYAQDEFKCE